MKKVFLAAILILVLTLGTVVSASAQQGNINIKGEVTAVGEGTLTVQTNKGDTYVVNVPEGFDTASVQVGDSVVVKAAPGEGDTWQAQSIKVVGNGENEETDDETESKDSNKGEGFKDNSAFCAEGKKDQPHPLAPKIAERYGISEETVMEYFCDGYSMGAIMLAIKTSQLDGLTADLGELLADRAAGNSWGKIWQGLGLIGSENEGHSPPGLLHKPDHAGPK